MSKKITDTKPGETPKGIVRAYQKIFKSKEGKIVLEDLKKSFNTEMPAFQIRLSDDSGETAIYNYDPIHAALKDGARSVVLHIVGLRDLSVSPDDEESGKKQVKVKR